MTIRVFYFAGSDWDSEEWLELEDDGSMTYSTSPNRYAYLQGEKGEYTKLSVAEAKERWRFFVREIDEAVHRLKST